MAKKKKSSNRPPGQDKQEVRQRRLDARRQAKIEAEERRRRQQRRELIVRYLILAFIGLSLFWFVFLRNQAPSEINGHPISQFSNAGVNDHTNDSVTYETQPPVAGAHAPSPLPCGVYNQTLPEERQVHMLEHGAVGIQYRPDLELEEIKEIEALVGEFDKDVFSAPYTEMETPIAVTSWSRKMELDSFDEDAVRQYIDEFAGEGPEADQDCPSDSDTPFEPAPTASPDATASPEPSPDAEGKKGKGKDKDES